MFSPANLSLFMVLHVLQCTMLHMHTCAGSYVHMFKNTYILLLQVVECMYGRIRYECISREHPCTLAMCIHVHTYVLAQILHSIRIK